MIGGSCVGFDDGRDHREGEEDQQPGYDANDQAKGHGRPASEKYDSVTKRRP